MSDYDDDDTDPEGDELMNSLRDSFTSLTKIKSNTPRARFDVHFHPTSIQLIQFSAQNQVSNRYRIDRDNIREMFRLPYSNDTQIFFVLHLKRSIVGGNKCFTKYDFVVFNFPERDYEEINLDLSNPEVREMFDEDIVESESIAGPTVEVFETLLTKIFGKDVTTPAINYDGDRTAPALQCTFWDNDEHFLYPLDNGFVNVWKYCQRLNLDEVKNVRFVRSEGRLKTFDFYIYPKMERAIRRYYTGAGKSNVINCFFLEFKAIDLRHYDSLFAYCNKFEITISTNDFRQSASDTDSGGSSDDSESRTPTETNVSESDDSAELIDDGFEAPDPHMVRIQSERRDRGSESGSTVNENESTSTSEEEVLEDRARKSPDVSQVTGNSSNPNGRRRRTRSGNVIADNSEDSSSRDSVTIKEERANKSPDDSQEIDNRVNPNGRRRKRSRNVIADNDEDSSSRDSATIMENRARKSPDDSQETGNSSNPNGRRRRKRSRNVIADDDEDSSSRDSVTISSRKRNSLRIDSDEETADGIPNEIVWAKNSLIEDSGSD